MIPSVDSARDRRRAAQVVAILTVLALVLRVLAAWHANAHLSDDPSRLSGDETNYDGLAYALLQGTFFQWPGRAPLYPLFLAGGYLAWDYSFAAVLYAQAVLAATVVPLTYLLARRCTRRGAALAAAAIVAVHPALIQQVVHIDSAVLFTPLLLAALLLVARVLGRPRGWRGGAAAGAALGLAALCEPSVLLLPLALPLAFPHARPWRARARMWGTLAAAMVLVVAPWSWHNWRTYHRVLPVSVSIAALWRGSPEFDALTRRGDTIVDVFNGALNPQVNGGHDPFTVDGDRWFAARGWRSIRAHPAAYAGYALRKAAYLWVGNRAGDWPHNRVFDVPALWRAYGPSRAAALLLVRLLPVVALLALFVLRHRLGDIRLLVVALGYVTVYHALLYAEVRVSEPWHPLLAIVIAAGAAELVRARADAPPSVQDPEQLQRLAAYTRGRVLLRHAPPAPRPESPSGATPS